MGTQPRITAVVLSDTILGRNRPRGVVIALCIASILGCAARVGPPERPAHLLEYHVAPPDVLTISVRPAPEIVRQLVIRPDGRISFDLIGDLEVQGKTVDEIRREITARLEEFIVHPDVTVVLSASNSRKYFVFGAVGRPGVYPLIGDVTALGALFAAGGPTRFSKMDGARIVRPSEGQSLVYAVDFEQITQQGDATTNYELQPGDIVHVPHNIFGKIGNALGVMFFPIQQILGLGRSVVYTQGATGGY